MVSVSCCPFLLNRAGHRRPVESEVNDRLKLEHDSLAIYRQIIKNQQRHSGQPFVIIPAHIGSISLESSGVHNKRNIAGSFNTINTMVRHYASAIVRGTPGRDVNLGVGAYG